MLMLKHLPSAESFLTEMTKQNKLININKHTVPLKHIYINICTRKLS